MVVEIPPADADHVIVGSFDVAWQNALADVGPAGADKGKGARYLITPPGYEENAPEGYIVLPSETYRGFVILRSNFKSRSDADIKSAVEHGKRVKIYPLGGNPDSTVFVDAYDKPFDATIPYDATFFELLDRFVQTEPWLTRDKVMIDSLKTIGIEKGKPFKPGAKTRAILDQAAQQATPRCRKIRAARWTSTSARPRRRARSPTGCRRTRSGSSNCCSASTARRRNCSRKRGSCRTSRK